MSFRTVCHRFREKAVPRDVGYRLRGSRLQTFRLPPNRRHTVSPAFGSLPWFRVMNEWQKAGSGLAASNDGYWVFVTEG